ncbi:SGNH/GDSL hydrolase family protein [Paludibacter sp.]|uniref:SGNH/GDSL hydrolase family protein n=1 Tax=Paludibacter sp. TaxID=1898105 RepID=UPI002600AC2B|nr:SGNH/GDSL hydrolase family protein [Paludibacter sp.]
MKKSFSIKFGDKGRGRYGMAYSALHAMTLMLLSAFLFSFTSPEVSKGKAPKTTLKEQSWVGTWSTAPYFVDANNMAPAPGLTNNSFRQVVRVSVGGDVLRFRFTNLFCKNAVVLKSVGIAVSKGGSDIDAKTNKILKFAGKKEVTMSPETEIVSDPISFHVDPGMKVAITICFGEAGPNVGGHAASRTTSYLLQGNKSLLADFSHAIPTDHWFVIRGIDVMASNSTAAIAILGNSIVDGRGSGTSKFNRWTDVFSDRLLHNPATKNRAVLNLGIGGNCVVRGGQGDPAVARFDRDILEQNGVKWLIISEGINDIGGIKTSEQAAQVAHDLIEAYKQMIEKAHAKGMKVYGATILPFAKSFYDKDFRQTARDTVNAWIRTSGSFDAVIDFEKVMNDPKDPKALSPDLQSGDFLHPNEAGYAKMGEYVDLKLFE